MYMDVHELKEKLASGEDILLLDVRERDEIAQAGGMVAGAQNIPMGEVPDAIAKGALPKEKKIVTICKSGRRSEMIARILRQQGYIAESLEGGMDEWNSAR